MNLDKYSELSCKKCGYSYVIYPEDFQEAFEDTGCDHQDYIFAPVSKSKDPEILISALEAELENRNSSMGELPGILWKHFRNLVRSDMLLAQTIVEVLEECIR